MEVVRFEFFDNNRIKLNCERGVLMEISDAFTFYAPNFKWNPKFKNGFWDGKIRFIDLNTSSFLFGLFQDVISYCRREGYKIELDEVLTSRVKSITSYDEEEAEEFLSTLNVSNGDGELISLRDFQKEAVHECLKYGRRVILSATGSGKSLIIYALARYIMQANEKILIIVPSITLVNQLYSDFKEYSQLNKWNVEKNVHKIFGGQEKITSNITISTWQSLVNLRPGWFNDIGCVIADECHQTKATEIMKVIEKARLAHMRFGFTGTLDENKTNQMTIKGILGADVRVSSSKDLMDKEVLSSLKITPVLLQHNTVTSKAMSGKKWQEELDFLVTHDKRNRFIAGLAMRSKGNTLVILNYVDKHAKPLYEMLKKLSEENGNSHNVHFITGATKADVREEARRLAKSSDNNIYVATYGVFSTGVNIPSLNNCILASPTKAKIRVLQTVGRILRKAEGKEYATLIDIGDDLSGGKKKKNSTFGHFTERLRYYSEEGFTFDLKTFKEF